MVRCNIVCSHVSRCSLGYAGLGAINQGALSCLYKPTDIPDLLEKQVSQITPKNPVIHSKFINQPNSKCSTPRSWPWPPSSSLPPSPHPWQSAPAPTPAAQFATPAAPSAPPRLAVTSCTRPVPPTTATPTSTTTTRASISPFPAPTMSSRF